MRILKLFRFWTVCAMALVCVVRAGDVPSGLTDPDWTSGTLPNGFRYFIRPNAKPENRLELRLVVNAGSVLEEADQQGLAHYLEHVAFNGTENFEKNEMVKFLESLGVGFGPDLNAYTSFDETVYRLRLPTDKPDVVERGFLILADWAGRVTADDEAIEMERGIIIEEWRGRRGGPQRIRDLKFPVMFAGSRYAERLPIGILEVLEDFDFERLRDFYRDWYRPDLMSVIAVGNLDVEETRARIHEHFAFLTMPEDAPERPVFTHPPHEETKVGVFHDPELTSSTLTLMWKMPPDPVLTEDDYRRSIHEGLLTDMLQQRFIEISQRPDAPFLRASVYKGSYTRGGDVYLLFAQVEDEPGAFETAMEALLAESERMSRHGFSEGELDRAKRRRLRAVERMEQERENTEHDVWVREMIDHALTGTFVPGPARELELHREELEVVDADALLERFRSWKRPTDRVVLADGPSRNGAHNLPAEEALLAVFDRIEGLDLQPRIDTVSDVPLVEHPPESGEVVNREVIEELEVTILTLSNGVRVKLKPTPFKQDQILMSAWAPGGTNHLPLEDLPHMRAADSSVTVSGLGPFSAVELQNMLAGRLVSVSPGLEGNQASLNGGASPRDLETLFELIYLHFTAPGKDPEAFEAHRRRMIASVRNRLADPREVFNDLISGSMTQHHPRLVPTTEEMVRAMDLSRAHAIYRERFSNAAGFTFLFTGAFTLEEIEPLAALWLGGLPAEDEAPERIDLAVEVPRHELKHTVRMGQEPISEVRMIWTSDDFEYDFDSRHAVNSMIAALRIRAREVLREEMSGTYHVSVWPTFTQYPEPRVQLNIRFGCDPGQVDTLIQGVYDLLASFTTEPLAESYMQTVRETQRRQREVDLTRNEFWNWVLPFYDWAGEDPRVLLDFEDYVAGINAENVRDTARRFFRVPDHAVFVLMPKAEVEGEAESDTGLETEEEAEPAEK
ncbi:MAG: insulinase family protein [Verrucomicrobia bacterium]|nr:insulinase family protein [Verrucomicrobiota bacterium]MCH8526679.1 insulinase family protein [Kiritimatiellia bacterium]